MRKVDGRKRQGSRKVKEGRKTENKGRQRKREKQRVKEGKGRRTNHLGSFHRGC